jgi:hypothetical protein
MAQKELENDLKRYFKEIKLLFPVYGKKEKEFLADFISEVDEYIASNPTSDYAQLISLFSEPKTIVSRYIADADSAYLAKQIKTAKFVRIGIVAIIIAAVIVVALVIMINYVDYIKGQASYVDREVTEVIEGQ